VNRRAPPTAKASLRKCPRRNAELRDIISRQLRAEVSVRVIFIIILAYVLSGCGIAQRIQAQLQPKQQAASAAQSKETPAELQMTATALKPSSWEAAQAATKRYFSRSLDPDATQYRFSVQPTQGHLAMGSVHEVGWFMCGQISGKNRNYHTFVVYFSPTIPDTVEDGTIQDNEASLVGGWCKELYGPALSALPPTQSQLGAPAQSQLGAPTQSQLGAPTQSQLEMTATALKPSSWEAAQAATKRYFARSLDDPDAAQYRFSVQPIQGHLTMGSVREDGWFMCGQIKGYAAFHTFVVYFSPTIPDTVEDGTIQDNEASLVGGWCKQLYGPAFQT
jgi:hypothetical protein